MVPRSLAVAAFAVAFTLPAHAQQPADAAAADSIARAAPIMQALPNAEESPPPRVDAFAAAQLEGEFTAGNFIDRILYDTSGNEIGPIVDLGVDNNGLVSLVVVDVSDGGENKRIAFSFGDLAYQRADEVVRVVADLQADDVDNAPTFTSLADAAALHDMQSGVVEEPMQPAEPGR